MKPLGAPTSGRNWNEGKDADHVSIIIIGNATASIQSTYENDVTVGNIIIAYDVIAGDNQNHGVRLPFCRRNLYQGTVDSGRLCVSQVGRGDWTSTQHPLKSEQK